MEGTFRSDPNPLYGYGGIGVFSPSSQTPRTVYYDDERPPDVSIAASGGVHDTTLRYTLDITDYGEIDATTLTAGMASLTSGSMTVPATLTLDTSGNPQHRQATVTFTLPAVPFGQYRTWSLQLAGGVIKDRAGNVTAAHTFYFDVQWWWGIQGQWSKPPEPHAVPPAPFSLVPFRGAFGQHFAGSKIADRMVFDRDGTVIVDAERGYRFVGSTDPAEPLLVQLKGSTVNLRSTSTLGEVGILSVADTGHLLIRDTQDRLLVVTDFFEATFAQVQLPPRVTPDPASMLSTTMSRDGKLVVFLAVSTASASLAARPTIYVAINHDHWEAVPLTDQAGDGLFGDSEQFDDLNLDGQFTSDPPEDSQPDQPMPESPLGIVSFTSDHRFRVVYETLSGLRTIDARFDPATAILTAVGMSQSIMSIGADSTGQLAVRYGAESSGAARTLVPGLFKLHLLDRPVNPSGRVGASIVNPITGDAHSLVAADNLGKRPVLILPGLFGTMPTSGVAEWLLHRGVHPGTLALDPLFKTYTDLFNSLQNVGYKEDDDLFAAVYDWRLPPAPVREKITGEDQIEQSPDAPWKRNIDGVISDLTINSLADEPTFQHGVDYLAYWLNMARKKWGSRHPGHPLISVDVYAHSTGGIITRSYIQSDIYGSIPELPTVNIFISMAVPHRGASKAWNVLHDNMAADSSYQIFISKIAHAAFRKVMDQGYTIAGPTGELDINRQRINDAVRMYPDLYRTPEEAFISMYIPTGRALLATYPFLLADGGLVTVNQPDPWGSQQNTLVLDLNRGFDVGPGNSDPHYLRRLQDGRDDPLASLVYRTSVRAFYATDYKSKTGNATYAYAEQVYSLQVDRETGDFVRGIYPMSRSPFGAEPRYPDAEEVWWIDRDAAGSVPPMGGDGTVGAASAGDIFLSHPAVRVHRRDGVSTDHAGLNSEPNTQLLVLRELGLPVVLKDIKTGKYDLQLLKTISKAFSFVRDPVGGVVVDRFGRRAGWSPDTGSLSEIPGSFSYGDSEGITFLPDDLAGPLRLIVTGVEPTFAVKLTVPGPDGVPVIYDYSGEIGVGESVSFNAIQVGSPPDPASEFISVFYNQRAGGLARGDSIVQELVSRVPDAAYGRGWWGGTNYWFQDASGDVWALWHGGAVHANPDLPGQHDWVLTNLTEAAGLSGSFGFEPGTLSGIATGWNAFNTQGIADGKLWALWWAPGGSPGLYLDTDRTWKQGLGLGLRGNGWVLSSISDAWVTPAPAGPPPSQLRGFTESQGNSRTSFDPRPSRFVANDGMSIVVVDTSNKVYVVSFSIAQRPISGARPDLNQHWVVEELKQVPSIHDFQLGPQLPGFEEQYVAASIR